MPRKPITVNVYIPINEHAERALGIEPGSAIVGSDFGGRINFSDPQPVAIYYPNGEGDFEERVRRGTAQAMADVAYRSDATQRILDDNSMLAVVGEYTIAPPHVLTWHGKRRKAQAEAWIARWRPASGQPPGG
jgi:hypothetical protein